MAFARHHGGPVDGKTIRLEQTPPVRYYAPRAARKSRTWVPLARYVYVPPRDRKWVTYQYTGEHQQQGPVPGADDAPDWSI